MNIEDKIKELVVWLKGVDENTEIEFGIRQFASELVKELIPEKRGLYDFGTNAEAWNHCVDELTNKAKEMGIK